MLKRHFKTPTDEMIIQLSNKHSHKHSAVPDLRLATLDIVMTFTQEYIVKSVDLDETVWKTTR